MSSEWNKVSYQAISRRLLTKPSFGVTSRNVTTPHLHKHVLYFIYYMIVYNILYISSMYHIHYQFLINLYITKSTYTKFKFPVSFLKISSQLQPPLTSCTYFLHPRGTSCAGSMTTAAFSALGSCWGKSALTCIRKWFICIDTIFICMYNYISYLYIIHICISIYLYIYTSSAAVLQKWISGCNYE